MSTPIDSANDQPKAWPLGNVMQRIAELRARGMSTPDALRTIERTDPELVELVRRHALAFGLTTIRPFL